MTDRIPFRDGIARQAAALAASRMQVESVLDAMDLEPYRTGTVALTGIGASLYAAITGAAQFRAQGRRAFAVPATELYDPAFEAADSYVALSASGRSAEPAHAMGLRSGSPRLGIAKAAGTPLEQAVTRLITTGTGPDSGPNTTSFSGSLQALGLLADRIGRPSGFDWASLPDRLDRMADQIGPSIERAAAMMAGRIAIDCVGCGTACGIAGYAALLIREAVRVAAQSWDTLNFLHGPMEPNDQRSGVVLFGQGREVTLAQDLAGFGIPTVLVTSRVGVSNDDRLVVVRLVGTEHGLADAILKAVAAQRLTASLAEAAGLPVCEFRYRQTDTKIAV